MTSQRLKSFNVQILIKVSLRSKTLMKKKQILEVNGDWVLVNYDGADFPREKTNIVGSDHEVNVMHKCGAFWKWPLYRRQDNLL